MYLLLGNFGCIDVIKKQKGGREREREKDSSHSLGVDQLPAMQAKLLT